jgi:dTDP-4-dehydrorhamnose reductase
MITIFGSHGYIGSDLVEEMDKRRMVYGRGSYRQTFLGVMDMLRDFQSELVINASAFIPTPSVDLCKEHRLETLKGNLMFPAMLAHACELQGIPFAHIGTACLYDDKKEYSETDPPTRDFNGYCGFYLETKWMSEQIVREYEKSYVWRIRLPFDEIDHPKNYLTKLRSYPEVWEHENSITHRGDFAKAALDLWELRAPYGVYHMTNPGSINAVSILFKMNLKSSAIISAGPVTGSRLSAKKLLDAGVKIRPVEEAVSEAIKNWRKPNDVP